jgi:NAD(P)-dependent dehydrogenase (short-subunit alcohol dehydrogenase family)
MPSHIDYPVVVITGASSGIGRATAHAFAKQGASVVLGGVPPLASRFLTHPGSRHVAGGAARPPRPQPYR